METAQLIFASESVPRHWPNEDSVFGFVRPVELGCPCGLFIVADGLGGYQHGEIASQLVVETVFQELKDILETADDDGTHPQFDGIQTSPEKYLEKRLRVAIEKSNAAVLDFSRSENRKGTGSTVTCALVYDNVAVIANVGHCRTYLFHNSELKQITQDHTWNNLLEKLRSEGKEAPNLKPEMAQNILFRTIGNEENVETDTFIQPVNPGDTLLLCSDGIWATLEEVEISRCLHLPTPEAASQALISELVDQGLEDDTTLIVCKMVDQ